MSNKFYWHSVATTVFNRSWDIDDKVHLLYTNKNDYLLNQDLTSLQEAPLYVARVYPSRYDYCFELVPKRYPDEDYDGFGMAAGSLDEMKLLAEETVYLKLPKPLHWMDQLTIKQKELLLYCFSTAFCMEDSVNPLGAYLAYEGFLAKPYIHSKDNTFVSDLVLLKRAMVVFLKTTAPGYEEVITVEDFDKCVDDYIKEKRAGQCLT